MLNIESYEIGRPSKFPEKDWLPSPKSAYQKYTRGLKRRRRNRTDIDEYHEHTPRICSVETIDSLPQKFKRLLAEWQEESIVMSSITEMVMLPSYQAIIGMGPAAVRLILNELKHDPDYLFWALEAITWANPVLPEDEGNLDRMTKAWIKWGQENRII